MQDIFEFSARLLSKMKIMRSQDVDDELARYITDIMYMLEEENPQLHESMLQSRDFTGSSKSCTVTCCADYPLDRNPRIFELVKKSCKSVLMHVGKPHNPDSMLTFLSYGLKAKEMSNSDGSDYTILTVVNGLYSQFIADFHVTKVEENKVQYEFTITFNKVL